MVAQQETASPTSNGNGIPNGMPTWNTSIPKNLMVPWILLIIKQWSAHGYLLLNTLRQMGFTSIDHATLYKELRNMEKQGLLSSAWGTDGSGPAKRIYSLTPNGEELLKAGAEAMTSYQRMFTNFFDTYTKMTGWQPSTNGHAATPPTPPPPSASSPKRTTSKTGKSPKGA